MLQAQPRVVALAEWMPAFERVKELVILSCGGHVIHFRSDAG
jgi:hypothetical protein